MRRRLGQQKCLECFGSPQLKRVTVGWLDVAGGSDGLQAAVEALLLKLRCRRRSRGGLVELRSGRLAN